MKTPISDPVKILESAYSNALNEFRKDRGESFLACININARRWIEVIAKNCEKQKAVVTALITSLTKKIESPSQDIRYHKVELPGGYSARTFDTRYVTPFLKGRMPRIAMKESGWLTRSIEQPHAFTLKPLFPGKISNEQVKKAFLEVLNDIEVNNADPWQYLIGLFILLIHELSNVQATIISMPPIRIEKEIEIETVIDYLRSHFFAHYTSPGASKLPVIAIHSLYQVMVRELGRYRGKRLEPLMSHISPDMRAGRVGDIEVTDENGECFEAVEIKHNIPIDAVMVDDAYKKFKHTPIKRYYLLTTAEPYMRSEEEWNVKILLGRIRKDHGCEVIVNGLMQSIKYYLRLIRSPKLFLNVYTHALKVDAEKASEIKEEHLKKWSQILEAIK